MREIKLSGHATSNVAERIIIRYERGRDAPRGSALERPQVVTAADLSALDMLKAVISHFEMIGSDECVVDYQELDNGDYRVLVESVT